MSSNARALFVPLRDRSSVIEVHNAPHIFKYTLHFPFVL
jgi:hypothetical protein